MNELIVGIFFIIMFMFFLPILIIKWAEELFKNKDKE